MSRRYSREMAMKALFQIEVGKNEPSFVLKEVSENIKDEVDEVDLDYFNTIINLTLENLKEIDSYIERFAENWRIDRIGKVDLSILRLALAEIFYLEDIPYKVSINEAVEMGKKYSTSDSPSYINGVLDNIAKSLQE